MGNAKDRKDDKGNCKDCDLDLFVYGKYLTIVWGLDVLYNTKLCLLLLQG